MMLLDTDVVIDLLRGLPVAVDWFKRIGEVEIILPGYVAMELVQGCRTKDELGKLEDQVSDMLIAWPDSESCDRALTSYSKLRFSCGLGLLDALVAQLAISLDLPLITFNQKHYAGISELNTIQPYVRQSSNSL